MRIYLFSIHSLTLLILLVFLPVISNKAQTSVFEKDYIIDLMHSVNNYQIKTYGEKLNRNWQQATYYTGLMAFYNVTHNNKLLDQAISWANQNEWKIGNEMFFPANRLTCSQTYIELFFISKDSSMIKNTIDYLDAELVLTEPAYLRGWFYIDALYVGTPPFAMINKATRGKKYVDFMNHIFWEIADQLYDKDEDLFYRDGEARYNEKSKNGKKVLWSRGNGWAIASIPRILTYLEEDNPYFNRYVELLDKMASSLAKCQGKDGLWRTNLADYDEFSMPESSGTAFFTYALAWGINNGILEKSVFESVVKKAWVGLCSVVDHEGKVCWGQPEARKPGEVKKDDSDEFVAGAFLLAGSEMLKLIENYATNN